MKILILVVLFAVLIYGFVIAFLSFKKRKEEALLKEEEKKLLMKNQEENFVGLLKHLTHQALFFLCCGSKDPICFNFSLEESSDGPLFVFSLNSKKQSINIREEMKKATFKEDGTIIYKRELIEKVREAISSVSI